MNVYKLSASNIKTFQDCPFKYKLKYHDRVKELEPANPWGPPGSGFHEAVRRYLEANPNDKIIDKSKFMELLAEEFNKLGVGLDEYKAYSAYVEAWIKRVEFPYKILGVEQEIDITLPNGLPFKMILDLVEEIDDNTIRVRDWKTGQVYSEEDMEENIQAPIYIIGAKQLYPDKKILFVFDFIKHVQLEYKYDNDAMKAIVKYLAGAYGAITSMPPEDAAARLGSHCKFCGYHDQCPALAEAKEQGVQYEAITTTAPTEELIRQAADLDDIIKGLSDEKDRVRALLQDRMEADGDERVESNGIKATLGQRKYTNYDVDVVCRAFAKKGQLASVVKVLKTNVDKNIGILPDDVQAEIEASASVSYGNQSITITRPRGKNGRTGTRKQAETAGDDQLW